MKIIFAGGGTAGHIYPAVAVADLLREEKGAQCLFFGGEGNMEERLIPQRGYRLVTRPLGGLSRKLDLKGIKKNIRSVVEMKAAERYCKKLIDSERPDVVMGTGGYVSYPMVSAAVKKGVKTAILEVNAAAGFATRRLAGRVDKVMLCYEDAGKGLATKSAPVITGCPVREEILTCRERTFEPYFDNSLPTVLCFWGSAGAEYMNKKMEDFIVLAAGEKKMNLLMATGRAAWQWMPVEIAAKGCDVDRQDNIILKEYIYDMDRAMALSDLILSRAGGTLNEICAAGKPSVIVPSPYVTDNHQEKNARALESAGAAVVISEKTTTGGQMYRTVLSLLNDGAKLRDMSEKALGQAHPNALRDICGVLTDLL